MLRTIGMLAVLTSGTCLTACQKKADTYTLYRTSTLSTERVHWATFDVASSDLSYNLVNCSMAMDLLNKNVRALNRGDQAVSFWCEAGRFKP